MNATQRYVQEIESRYRTKNGKEIADLLGVAEMSVSRYRNQQKGFADDVAIKAAQLLNIDPKKIVAELQEERATTPETKALWREFMRLTSV